MGGAVNMSEVKNVLAGVTIVVSALKIVIQHRGQVVKEIKKDKKRN